MKTQLTILFALIPTLAFADYKADVAKVEADTQHCLDQPDNYSTYGMNSCLAAGYTAADKILNQTYKAIVADLKKKSGDEISDNSNAETLVRLVKAQRAWIAYRDAQSTLQGVEMLGGSGESQVVIGSLYDMTKTRINDLASLLGTGRQN